jgi:protein-L-isoaspartate(D-aspartate) O-methyltransferase
LTHGVAGRKLAPGMGRWRMQGDDAETVARERLLAEIAAEAAETAEWTGRARFSSRTYAALRAVPRHAFVADRDRPFAYINRPLGIGHGQTISQPYIVALMTDLLDLAPRDRVLEIGTGCGYQAAVLSRLCQHVYSLEVVPELAAAAATRLAREGFANITVRAGDGFLGWLEASPFDGVIVTAAPPAVPGALTAQLAAGGRIVIPIGPPGATQVLYRGVKQPNGDVDLAEMLPVAFVPMVRCENG